MRYFTQPSIGTPLNPAHTLNSGLVGYWPMGEGAGSVTRDMSGKGNHGTLINMVQGSTSGWTGGKFGSGILFDGVNDVVQIPHNASLNLTNRFAISLWFKPSVLTQTNRYLLSKVLSAAINDNAYSVIWEYVNNTVEFYSGSFTGTNPRLNTQIVVTKADWSHVMYVYDGFLLRSWLNGVVVNASSPTFNLVPTTGNLFIGNLNLTSLAQPAAAAIAEVRIYNRALTVEESQRLYHDPFCMYEQENKFRWLTTFDRKGSFFFSRL